MLVRPIGGNRMHILLHTVATRGVQSEQSTTFPCYIFRLPSSCSSLKVAGDFLKKSKPINQTPKVTPNNSSNKTIKTEHQNCCQTDGSQNGRSRMGPVKARACRGLIQLTWPYFQSSFRHLCLHIYQGGSGVSLCARLHCISGSGLQTLLQLVNFPLFFPVLLEKRH